MERAGGSQYVHFEAIDTTSGNRRPSDAANITPYCVIDNGTPNSLTTTTIIEWSAAKSGTGIYAMQPSGAEANGKNILYFAISSTPNTRCVPVAVAMNPDGFSQSMSGGALVNGVTVQFNNDKVGYALSAASITAIWDEVLEGARSARKFMRLLLSIAVGKVSGMASNHPLFRDPADTKTRVDATTTSDGDRTNVILDDS